MVRGSIDRAHRKIRRCDQLYARPGRDLWWSGGEIQRDNIAVIEVMAGRLEREHWKPLRERLKRQLSQEEVFRLLVLRCSGKKNMPRAQQRIGRN
jgi:hypothetical protein